MCMMQNDLKLDCLLGCVKSYETDLRKGGERAYHTSRIKGERELSGSFHGNRPSHETLTRLFGYLTRRKQKREE